MLSSGSSWGVLGWLPAEIRLRPRRQRLFSPLAEETARRSQTDPLSRHRVLGGAGQPRPALPARAAVLESGDEGAARVRRAATTEMFAISSRALLHRLAQARHVGLRPLPGKWGYFDLISKRTGGGGGGRAKPYPGGTAVEDRRNAHAPPRALQMLVSQVAAIRRRSAHGWPARPGHLRRIRRGVCDHYVIARTPSSAPTSPAANRARLTLSSPRVCGDFVSLSRQPTRSAPRWRGSRTRWRRQIVCNKEEDEIRTTQVLLRCFEVVSRRVT